MSELTPERIVEIQRLVESVNSAEFHDEMPAERELADALQKLLAERDRLQAQVSAMTIILRRNLSDFEQINKELRKQGVHPYQLAESETRAALAAQERK